MKITSLLLITVCLTLAESTVCADYVLIKYRSGKVQTLRLDEPSSGIISITYQDDNASILSSPPATTAKTDAGVVADKAVKTPQKSTGIPKSGGKPPVRIEWASPVE